MIREESKRELLDQIRKAVVSFDEEACERLCKEALEGGMDPREVIRDGLAAAMSTVGEFFTKQKYFVPELLLCSDALYRGLDILRPHLRVDAEPREPLKLLIGTVEGDIHDIGKNLVKTMFEAAGWEIYDLGKDVTIESFVEAQRECNAHVVGMSALMTTSMMGIPKAIERLKAEFDHVFIMVGGAALSADIAKRFGADGYASDAVAAVQEARRLLKKG
jgi:corrinoid protein of di/trimethylamine methyltransferase